VRALRRALDEAVRRHARLDVVHVCSTRTGSWERARRRGSGARCRGRRPACGGLARARWVRRPVARLGEPPVRTTRAVPGG